AQGPANLARRAQSGLQGNRSQGRYDAAVRAGRDTMTTPRAVELQQAGTARPDDRFGPGFHDSRLRMQTIIRLRWFGVGGQLVTVAAVRWGLGFEFPVGACLALIALSAWVNVFLRIRYPARHRLSPIFAS